MTEFIQDFSELYTKQFGDNMSVLAFMLENKQELLEWINRVYIDRINGKYRVSFIDPATGTRTRLYVNELSDLLGAYENGDNL